MKIGDESFSIKEIPSSDTDLVLKKKDIILGAVDLPALVSDLGQVGICFRIAYNGVAGYTELQIEIRQIAYDLTKLCDKSAVTAVMAASLKATSESVLDHLKSAFGFLLSGFEEMALTTLKAVTDVAKGMATAADELHKEFDEESKRVDKVLSSMYKQRQLADVTVDALFYSAGRSLQELSATMMKAALFWKQVQMHCERLAQERMTEMVALAMEMEKQERIELWKDPTFQEEAIGYYAEWVALDDVCGIYMEKIKETKKELYDYLTEKRN